MRQARHGCAGRGVEPAAAWRGRGVEPAAAWGTASSARLRGAILGSVQPGATYHVVGECPDCMWYKISGPISGYVYASYLVPAGEYQQASNSNSDTGTGGYSNTNGRT